jgi:hypothetical protein
MTRPKATAEADFPLKRLETTDAIVPEAGSRSWVLASLAATARQAISVGFSNIY